jgi:cell division protein FtsI/penicillin-binding protein 2
LAAKTGSAQVGTADSPRTDVWMVVMYPGYANEVRLVIAAMAHDQTSGGRDLGHRLGRLVERIQEWESWTEDRRRQWPDGGNAGTVAQLAR